MYGYSNVLVGYPSSVEMHRLVLQASRLTPNKSVDHVYLVIDDGKYYLDFPLLDKGKVRDVSVLVPNDRVNKWNWCDILLKARVRIRK
jgi:hypothetical protein